jgi:phosphoribosylformylglycinamidine synthase
VSNLILAGHDVSSGGLITTLLEMCFTDNDYSMKLDLDPFGRRPVKILFSEKPGLVIQVKRMMALRNPEHAAHPFS